MDVLFSCKFDLFFNVNEGFLVLFWYLNVLLIIINIGLSWRLRFNNVVVWDRNVKYELMIILIDKKYRKVIKMY